MLRARVFNKKISEFTEQLTAAPKESVPAKNMDDGKRSNQLLERLFEDFNETAGKFLPRLYKP